MYSLLYYLYFWSYPLWQRNNSKAAEFVFRVSLKLMRLLLSNNYIKRLKNNKRVGINQKPRNEKIIASLTSFPARIDTVWIAIETIMRQTIKADRIELWLSREQFPKGIDDLPQSLLEQTKRGLSICFCDGDLRSHKKYYFAMQAHPNDVIITFDDDIFYPLDSIEKVYKLHKQEPENVVGMSMSWFSIEDINDPISWEIQYGVRTNVCDLSIIGCACTLFPPRALHENAFNADAIKRLCPLADDMWLTAMLYMNGKRMSSVGRTPFPISVPNVNNIALTNTNDSVTSPINNNTQWAHILNCYSDELEPWIRELKEYRNARIS